MIKKILVGNVCNNDCQFCVLLGRKAKKDKGLEEIKKEIDLVRAEGQKHVLISGGEPALRGDIQEILEYAKSKGLNIVLETNARLFSDKEFLKKFLGYDISYSVFLFSDSEARRAGSLAESTAGLSNILSLEKDVIVTLVVTMEKLPYIKDIVYRLKSMGVKKIKIDFPEKVMGYEKIFTESVPSMEEAFPKISEAIDFINNNDMVLIPNDRKYSYMLDENLTNDFDKIVPKFIFEKYTSRKKASVIIPTSNRKEYLKKTLEALNKQKFSNKEFEVIIVDDNSDDGTEDMVNKLKVGFNLKYLFWPRDKKFVPGQPQNRAGPLRNLGVKFSDSDIIIFIDCDIVVNGNFIGEHLKSQKDSDIVIGPSIREDTKKDNREGYFQVCNDDLKNTDMILWELAHEGNISFKKKDFLDAGGFSDEFVYWAFEGDDLAYKLIKYNGKSISLNRKAHGLHLYHPPEFVDTKIRNIGGEYNATVLYKKHLDKDIYYRFFKLSSLKPLGELKKCADYSFLDVPFSALLTKCVENVKCKDIFLCKSRPLQVKAIINDQKKKTIFFRIDDVYKKEDNLDRLFKLFIKNNVPLNLQVIPKKLDKDLAEDIKELKKNHPELVSTSQHGFDHSLNWNNHTPFEFGFEQGYEEQYKRIKEGMKIMEENFKDDFFKLFTPPYHSFNKLTIKALEDLGFLAFSASFEEKIESKLKSIPVHIDPYNSYFPEFRRKKETDFFREFINLKEEKDTIGIVLHPDRMNYSDLKVIERMIVLLKMNNGIDFKTIEQIYFNS